MNLESAKKVPNIVLGESSPENFELDSDTIMKLPKLCNDMLN